MYKRDYINTINYLKSSKCDKENGDIYQIAHNINLDIAVEALKKQIPIDTQETQELMTIEYICPVCHCTSARHFNYCWNCGQAISNN